MSATEANPSENSDAQIPNADVQKVRTVAESDPEAFDILVDTPRGYAEKFLEYVRENWGEEWLMPKPAVYNVSQEFRDQVEEGLRERPEGDEEGEEADVDEDDEEEAVPEVSVAELSATAQRIRENPTNSQERIQSVIMDEPQLLRQAYRAIDEEFIEDIRDRVEEEFGPLYTPTEGTVRTAVQSLRMQDSLPEFRYGDGLDGVEGPAEIWYVCELCGERRKRYQAIKDHISCSDDSLHADRSAKESHLISTEGKPIEDTHEAFSSEDVRESLDDGFDLLWTLYQNPGARQGDIAKLLDISATTLKNRLRKLGIDWENREEEVRKIIEDTWNNGSSDEEERVVREAGNARYEGSPEGVQTTSGRPGQNIADRPVKGTQETLTLEITEEEAMALLTDRDPSAVKSKLLNELLAA